MRRWVLLVVMLGLLGAGFWGGAAAAQSLGWAKPGDPVSSLEDADAAIAWWMGDFGAATFQPRSLQEANDRIWLKTGQMADDLMGLDIRTRDLQARIDALETMLEGVTRVQNPDTLLFTGMNLQVVNGTGTTDLIQNGEGNVIIGYNTDNGDDKSGSHNLVVGGDHTYNGYSGLVVGADNTIGEVSAAIGLQNTAVSLAFVGAGQNNTASHLGSFVGGGDGNTASGQDSFVGGGDGNTASELYAFVGGGQGNTASNLATFVGGGQGNTASEFDAFVGGGGGNTASGSGSFVGGGATNTASGGISFVGGGEGNTASSLQSFVGGGGGNTASDVGSFVGGGQGNTASGLSSFVGGGSNDEAGPGTCAWIVDTNVVPC